MNKITKFQLISSLFNRDTKLNLEDGRQVIVLGIAKESGDGRSFNVTGYVDGAPTATTFFLRTID